MEYFNTIIIGAGASGLFCAAQIGKWGKTVAVLDNGKKIGRKILMSGGGFCNFTNLDVTPRHYLSRNPHFVKSALARFTQWDFIAMVAEAGIAYHEKEDGQLFCDNGAQDIVEMLARQCERNGVRIILRRQIESVEHRQGEPETGKRSGFTVCADGQLWQCDNLVIASGGLSMPGLGASPFGYRIAKRFGMTVLPPRAGLVPFTYRENDKFLTALSGVSLPVTITARNGVCFHNRLLFTHRGISGPAVLQISNYWQPNESLTIDLLPSADISELLRQAKTDSPKIRLKTLLTRVLPKKLVELWLVSGMIEDGSVANLTKVRLEKLANLIHRWHFQPNGTEGYRTAEVTLGGVDTREISSKTMESLKVKGLYFIGEVLDVTGRLGGYNFQWAWSSAYVCAQGIAKNRIL